MNKLLGSITRITEHDNLLLIELKVNNNSFSSILIKDSENYYIDQKIYLIFKETEVSIAKNLSGKISIRNRIRAEVIEINKGKILSKIVLKADDNFITSIITTNACNDLELVIGDIVEAMIKTNEISLMKI